jgi:hypothetical protein
MRSFIILMRVIKVKADDMRGAFSAHAVEERCMYGFGGGKEKER